MKYELILTGKFKKGLKLAKKRGLNISLLEDIVEKLLHKIPLAERNRDHALLGKYKGYRECHLIAIIFKWSYCSGRFLSAFATALFTSRKCLKLPFAVKF